MHPRLRPNVALKLTGRLLMERARALLMIALQLNSGIRALSLSPGARNYAPLAYEENHHPLLD